MNLSAQKGQKEYQTFNEEIAIGIGEDSIAVYALIASGDKKKETVILLHGLPGNEKKLRSGTIFKGRR
jgi:predicted alpha/beta-fold hydrolase